ncbi:unnamed protein product [Arctia plantaginis]|uniref:ZAD domain-containing protein n=1 Tax=Arctia plantaginis TaxID=874455 RepID=A0A8S0YVU4_ARCPL|nr:unnamed protein product [Arctia plantaginis]
MGSTENAYCRLCAVCKPQDKLVDLQIDQVKRNFIVNKLKLLDCQLDFSENILPKTVCLLCINALTHASDFVVAVEQAQRVLKDVIITQPIKKESDNSDCDETFVYEMLEEKYEDNITVKSESDNEASAAQNKALINHTGTTKNGKTKKVSDLDSIPLSQLKLTWEDYFWTCSYCETQFATVTDLISHSMKYHKSCNAYCCNDCNVKKLRHSMDMAKRKYTPGDLCPLDETTGKVKNSEMDKILEWKNKILVNTKPGRPKTDKVSVVIEIKN